MHLHDLTPGQHAAFAGQHNHGTCVSNAGRMASVVLQIVMFNQPAVLHAFLDHLTTALITYVGYQIEAGAQVVQLFDSWAHHLSPEQFAEFSLPYANRVVAEVRAKYPHVPLIFHANGGKAALARGLCNLAAASSTPWAQHGCVVASTSKHCGTAAKVEGYTAVGVFRAASACALSGCAVAPCGTSQAVLLRLLHQQAVPAISGTMHTPLTLAAAPAVLPSLAPGTGKLEVVAGSNADVIGLDWSTNMAVARQTLGSHKVQGNVDPMILFGTHDKIEAEVHRVLSEAGPKGHILNVGHGVVQGTPEENVGYFCELARQSGTFLAKQQQQPAQQQQAAAQQLVGSVV